jgi:hypothetical protein
VAKLYLKKLEKLSKQGYNTYIPIYLRTNVKFDTNDQLLPIEFDEEIFFWCNNKEKSAPYVLIPAIAENINDGISTWKTSAKLETILTYLGLLNYWYFRNVGIHTFIDIDHYYYKHYSSGSLFRDEYFDDLPNNCSRIFKLQKHNLIEFKKNGQISPNDSILLSYFREGQSLIEINKFYSFLSFFKILDYYFLKNNSSSSKNGGKWDSMKNWLNTEWKKIVFKDWYQFFSQEEKESFDREIINYESIGKYFLLLRDSISHTMLDGYKKYGIESSFYPYKEKDFDSIKYSLPAIRLLTWKMLISDKFLKNTNIFTKKIKI